MSLKKVSIMIVISLLISLFSLSTVFAAEDELLDPNIPESWYEAPQTASELNITDFNESPILQERVQEGELPPVEARLPDNPPVIEPLNEVGNYGGTATLWDIELGGRELSYWSYYNYGGGRTTTGGELVPSMLQDWEYSDDHSSLTLYLREGMKWSDGEKFSADDYIYWWEHVAQNEELNPTPPEDWSPAGLIDVTKEDEWAVTFHWDDSVPLAYFDLRLRMNPADWSPVPPSHFMEAFHPDFIGLEAAQALADEVGMDRWEEYYERVRDETPQNPQFDNVRPTIEPYIPVERSETRLVMERNPYFPFVDTEGNQLPYVDKISIHLATTEEMAATQAAMGEATFAARHLSASDIPLYMSEQEPAGQKTLLYSSSSGSELAIFPNPSTKDLKLREIFQNVDFRRALSLAINRESINERIFFGEAVPRQSSVPPTNKYFESRFAEAYAEYDPERAKEKLDEIGMVDVTGNGYRETPAGEEFNPTLYFSPAPPRTEILEIVIEDFSEIGINIDLQTISRELHDSRKRANEIALTCWGIGQVTGARFRTPGGVRHFAPVGQPAWVQWPGWTNWYLSDGDEGVEPPAEIKEMIEYAEIVMSSIDEEEIAEAARILQENHAENLWTIGTVGMAPKPIIIDENLKNVPETALWGVSMEFARPFHTEQFYFEE